MNNHKKKILIVCDAPKTLIAFRGKLMKALIVDYELAVFTPKIEQADIKNELLDMNIAIYENDLKGSTVSIFSDLQYIYQLYQLIRKLKPDVLFPYTFKPVIYGTLIAKFCKVNQIVPMLTGLGYNFLDQSNKKILIKKITKTLLKFSLKAHANTNLILQNKDDYKTLLKAKIINKENKTTIVNGSGVDLSYYRFSKPNPKEISFLMIARLINAKGIKEYFDAAHLIHQQNPEIKFKLIGPKDQNIDAIEEVLYQKIISGSPIQYIGEVTDVRPYIKACSVVVLPSYYGEGIPRSLLEGMAMGRAIITTDSVGCKETVSTKENTKNGFLIPIKNHRELAERMQHFISYPTDMAIFSKNSREYAKEKFDVKIINKQMLDVIVQ